MHLQFEAFERHPFLALLGDRAEMESLVRHVGPERFEQERVKDAEFFAGLISSWQREGIVDPGANPLAVAAVSRAVLALIQGRDLIGEDDWDGLVEGLAISKFGGLVFMLPLLSLYLDGAWQWLFVLLPTYWPVQLLAGGPWWLLGPGVIVAALWLGACLRRFSARAD